MVTLLLGRRNGPRVTRSIDRYDALDYGLLIGAAVLALCVLVLVFRHPPD